VKLLISKRLPYKSADDSPRARHADSIRLINDDSDERSYVIFAKYSDTT